MSFASNSAVRGALAMVTCAFLWSTGGLFIKLIDWNPFWIAGLRSSIAGIFLFFLVRKFRWRWSWPLVGAGVANAVCMVLYVLSNKFTTSANAIVIQYWAPVATAIWAVLFLKEKVHTEQIVALIATLVGLVMLFADKLGGGEFWGNLMALGSGLAFSFVFLFTRLQKDGEGAPLQSLMLSHVLAATASMIVAVFQPLPQVTLTSGLAIVALGIGQIGLAAVFFSYGIRRISAVTANLLSVIEPLFNPVWVFLVVGERPSAWTLAGGALILVSVMVAGVVGARRVPSRN
jgi:drug/metabolite transporter (DMT)-like permease